MDGNTWLLFIIGFAVATVLFGLGIWLYPRLNSQKGTPQDEAIKAFLMPLIFDGICAAYRVSEMGVDVAGQRLRGLDKKKIADSVYSLLPAKIGSFDIAVVKQVVTQQQFEQLVQNAFEQFDSFYADHHNHFDELFQQWITANRPAAATAPSISSD